MSTLENFMAYAAAFEESYADDDWSRLSKYFTDDAIYRIESDLFGAELSGPEAIFAGMKKSLDGFDRTFESRVIDIVDGPTIDGVEMRVGWTVTYRNEGYPPFVLRGQSFVRLRGPQIELLVDSFDDRVTGEAQAWMQETGLRFDPSYV